MNQITVVGIGAGSLEQLSIGVYRLLKNNPHLYLRTKEHPVVEQLVAEGITFTSFDDIYEKYDQFNDVYEEIVNELLDKATELSIVYAVPGHPLVAEKTVQLLMDRAPSRGITLEFAGGQSFFDATFQAVRIDPIEGFQFLDGTNFTADDLNVSQHIFIGQVYDQFVASEVKITLMEMLPDTYEVFIITNAGLNNETVTCIPLHLLDHGWTVNNLTTIYVPPVKDEEILYKNFSYLKKVIATLRSPEGCPWDRKQTHTSLKKYLIEETYEVLEAIDQGDDEHLVEELGDVLLQIMLHAQIGDEEGYFNIQDIIETLNAKMIRRHPHVFGEIIANNAEEVTENWKKIKELEKGKDATQVSIMSKVGKGLPALLQAYEIQKQAAAVGFDWDSYEPALEKVKEEWQEFLNELQNEKDGKTNTVMEFGDVLFALVNVARLLSIHPEEALVQANQKFLKRFAHVEEKARKNGRSLSEHSLEELDSFWIEAKELGL
ncbi:nucleoside triphosphate pyrophosphohydrolase [Bacillus kwashiorkori]|uniref:nucleoside triphosphate pyrophosphohydrolase n=1 Tax=Bacillus kwashiorkori TaxID=1522318 RepID=UPI000785037E|nr:nucleoside triphosphate pyrophosphohydrolase [Bacillus kwashiorkori]